MTQPLMQEYAIRCGADFIALTDDCFPKWPMGNKYRIRKLAKRYAFTLYVDSDVIVKRDAPNIFESVGETAMQDELPLISPISLPDYLWRFECIAKTFNRSRPAWAPNGGVLLFSAQDAEKYKPQPSFKIDWLYDQFALACSFNVKPTMLDRKWNWGFIAFDWWEGLDSAYFIHLNGTCVLDYRMKMVQRLISGEYSYLPPPVGIWDYHSQSNRVVEPNSR